jgi:hypothetical protein
MIACSGEDNPVEADIEAFQFPLKVGNKWHYDVTLYNTNIQIIDPNATFSNDTINWEIDLEVMKIDTIPGGQQVYYLKQTEHDPSGRVYSENKLYSFDDDGLYYHGNYGESSTSFLFKKESSVLKPPPFSLLTVPNHGFHNVLADSFRIVEPPFVVLKYPLALNSSWTYNDVIDFKIVETVELKTQAGTFDCFKVQWTNKALPDWEGYSYFNDKGFIKREGLSKNQTWTTEAGPEPIAKSDAVSEYTLSAFTVK